MTQETKMALYAELDALGLKMIQGLVAGKDYSDFEKRFNVLNSFLSAYFNPSLT